eukprot:6488198-Amphidinium_carterae.2
MLGCGGVGDDPGTEAGTVAGEYSAESTLIGDDGTPAIPSEEPEGFRTIFIHPTLETLKDRTPSGALGQ